MPIPYSAFYISNLATYGTAATPSQVQSQALVSTSHSGSAVPHTLTGSFINLAIISLATSALQKVILEAAVNTVNTVPGLSGQLVIQLLQDGVVIATATQSMDASGTGCTCNFNTEVTPGPGAHSYALQAKATGDTTQQVPANGSSMTAMVVSV